MKSKNYVPAIVAMAAVAMASCSNEDVNMPANSNGDAITFRTVIDNPLSRANTVTTDNLELFKTICLDPNGQLYFGPIDVKKNGPFWEYDGLYNWKGRDQFHKFFASTANLGNALFEMDGAYPSVSGFEVSSGCVVDAIGNIVGGESQNDLCVAFYEGTANDGDVALIFQHQLAKIEVNAMNSTPNRHVEVMGVRLVGLDKKGTWKYDETYLNDGPGMRNEVKGSWNITEAGTGDFCISLANSAPSVMLDGEYQSILPGGESFMVLPTTSSAWDSFTGKGSYLSVICRIVSTDVNGNASVIVPANGNMNSYGMAMIPLSFALEAGKKYTINLDFSMGSGQVDPTIPNVPGGGDDPDIVGGDPLNPGDFYEGGAIAFTVEVAEWKDGDSRDEIFENQ